MKKIKMMFEYTADCPFWDVDTGRMVDWDNLVPNYDCDIPLSMVAALGRLSGMYDHISPWHMSIINNRLKTLAVEFAAINPDLEVHFYDEVEKKTYKIAIHKTPIEFTEIPKEYK